jgi:shikimate dehydrogenase
MHNAAFKELNLNCQYHAFRVSPDNLKDALNGARALGFGGVNLTVPLKEKALEYIRPDPLAAKIKAVNTITFNDTITGYNTDGIGAMRALEDESCTIKDSSILILGAGGAARALALTFADAGGRVSIANRTPKRAEELALEIPDTKGYGFESLEKLLPETDILVNTTPLGMHPHTETTPLYASQLHSDLTVFDIVYNPRRTKLLEEAQKAGAKTVEGVMMLVYQGAEAFRIWTGKQPPVEIMKKTVLEGLQ